jgi:hypothetical protein
MNVFDYIPQGKLNDVDIDWPASTTAGITGGPQPLVGMLGEEFIYDETNALKLSNTTKGTLYACKIKLVRFLSTSTASNLVGRPVFWSNKKTYVVTPDAVATSAFAGIAITANGKGNMGYIVTAGEVDLLFDAALTKAVPALEDPIVLKIGGGVATGDVQLDATGWTNAIQKLWVGYVRAAVTAGAKSRVFINERKDYNRGIGGA